jgi:uncharacterized protein YbjT (DUF2867 family)
MDSLPSSVSPTPPGRFAVVSSLGADIASPSFYLRTKGEIERDLGNVGFASLTIARSGLLGGTRFERRLAEDVGKVALGLIGPILPARWRTSRPERVAEVLVEAIATGKPGQQVIASDQLA